MLLTASSSLDILSIQNAFEASPAEGWHMLTQFLGDSLRDGTPPYEGCEANFDRANPVYRMAFTALSYAASQFYLSPEALYLATFVDNLQGRAERSDNPSVENDIALDRYKSDVLVHFSLLGATTELDTVRLWEECTRSRAGTWRLDRLMEHRDYPNWAIKQQLQFVQLCTMSELAYQSGQLRECATIDLFLLAASGVSSKESTVVPAWYSQLQQFKFMRLFERGLDTAIDALSAKTLAQMCDSSLVQGSALRILTRFMDSFIRVDDLFPYNEGGCTAFKSLREARAEEKEAFEQCINKLIELVTPLDRFNTVPRKPPLDFPAPDRRTVESDSLLL